LVEQFSGSAATGIPLGAYEAMLYWKLYSQPAAVKNVCDRLREDLALRERASSELARISKALPSKLSQNVAEITDLVSGLTKNLHGMTSSCAIPVRTTLLHFVYPQVVPIFDKQVLLAVGVRDKDANHSYGILRNYIPHAWLLAERYQPAFTTYGKETGVRLIDMALWVYRGQQVEEIAK
jgi:hypothetical protein